VFLDVGGKKINVRRSLLTDLQKASNRNPMCEVLLNNHWSKIPTTTDRDGTVRIYLDRNPAPFEDLLEYVEYGTAFLSSDIVIDDKRLVRLREEGKFFTIDELPSDIDSAMVDIDSSFFGEPVSFCADKWVKFTAERGNAQWNWKFCNGNKALLSESTRERPLGFEVGETGTYLLFFSLHSIAVKAMASSQGYLDEGYDECVRVSVFRNDLNKTGEHWTIPIVRCGAFDYRSDDQRERSPQQYTASCAEPISLVKGNLLYVEHGYHSLSGPRNIGRRTGDLINHSSSPQCVNQITLVQVFGSSMTKWNVAREKNSRAAPSIATWTKSDNDFPESLSPQSLSEDGTQIQFKKAGYYLMLGRVASGLKNGQETNLMSSPSPKTQFLLSTKGGVPLHVIKELTLYESDDTDNSEFCKKRADYGSINDIVYVEKNSYIRVIAKGGSFLAGHGTTPDPFGKIPTQSLTALRLSPSARIDRYQVNFIDGKVSYKRVLGPLHGDEGRVEQEPLFVPEEGAEKEEGVDEDEEEEEDELWNLDGAGDKTLGFLRVADSVSDCHCMFIGSLPPLLTDPHEFGISIRHNNEEIVRSELPEDSRGNHSLNGIVALKKKDRIAFSFASSKTMDDIGVGHLAFLILN